MFVERMNTFMSPTKQHIIHGEVTPLEQRLKNKKKVTNSTVKISNFMLEQKSYNNPKDAERQAKIAKLINQKKTVMQKLKFGGKRSTKKQKRKSRNRKYTRKH